LDLDGAYIHKMPPRHLYIHVPFCARRCSYCDFSIAVRSTTPVEEYVSGLRTELDGLRPDLEGATLDTVYLGGGTPSRLGGLGIAKVLSTVQERAKISDATWARLAQSYDERGLIELAMLVGHYHLVAFALNSLEVELDEGLDGLPR